jgi:hypothetical protein
MADLDTFAEDFIDKAHAHAGGTAETILTIPTVTDRHYHLLVTVTCIRDDSQTAVGFTASLLCTNDAGTVGQALKIIDTHDPSAEAYTLTATTSGTDVLLQLAAAAATVSSARAAGVSHEQDITGA